MPLPFGRGDLAGQPGDRVGIDAELARPISASPDSFSRMRLKRGRVMRSCDRPRRYEKGGRAFMARAAPLPTAYSAASGDRLGLRRAGGGGDFGGEVASCFFSMPSPSWKRTKPLSAIGAPASLPACGDDVGDRGLVVHHEQLRQQRILLAELGHGRLRPSSRRCSAACRFPSPFPWRSRARARSASASSSSAFSASGLAAAMCIAICLPSAVQRLGRAALSSATSTPILPRPGATCVVDVGDDHALGSLRATAARRSDWFSPIVAMLSVSFSATVPPPG